MAKFLFPCFSNIEGKGLNDDVGFVVEHLKFNTWNSMCRQHGLYNTILHHEQLENILEKRQFYQLFFLHWLDSKGLVGSQGHNIVIPRLLMYPHLLLFHLFNIFAYLVFKFAFFEFRNKLKSGSNWSTQILGVNMHYLFTFHPYLSSMLLHTIKWRSTVYFIFFMFSYGF